MTVENITAEDFQRYARAKNISIECPVCGDTDISIHTESDGQSYSLLEMNRASPSVFNAGIAWIIILLCRQCGHVRTFLRPYVEEWLKANAEQ